MKRIIRPRGNRGKQSGAERVAMINTLAKENVSRSQIAARLGITTRHLRRIMKAAKIRIPKRKTGPTKGSLVPRASQRQRWEVIQMKATGYSERQISDAVGISQPGVHAIMNPKRKRKKTAR